MNPEALTFLLAFVAAPLTLMVVGYAAVRFNESQAPTSTQNSALERTDAEEQVLSHDASVSVFKPPTVVEFQPVDALKVRRSHLRMGERWSMSHNPAARAAASRMLTHKSKGSRRGDRIVIETGARSGSPAKGS